MSAVVMIMSTSLHWSPISAFSASWYSFDISFAYPPWPSPDSLILISRNSAPIDSTCSLQAARTSNARTMAPMPLAVAMADNPATPAPITRTFAGFTLPAAVIVCLKYRPKLFAASTTALYPAMLAMELRTSYTWDRVIRGIQSIAKTVIFAFWNFSTSAGFCPGATMQMRIAPSFIRSNSWPSPSSSGARTFNTMSAPNASALLTISAPAFWYTASGKSASAPAPPSTTTLKPFFLSNATFDGAVETRLSSSCVSFGTPMVRAEAGDCFWNTCSLAAESGAMSKK
mmetsp:Transcript_64157/g.106060  ORF Transcript_64157/g.106060 Transcript_64157/m.106060 type:complete len:286 (-) Transcript_64157:19-876(-)